MDAETDQFLGSIVLNENRAMTGITRECHFKPYTCTSFNTIEITITITAKKHNSSIIEKTKPITTKSNNTITK